MPSAIEVLSLQGVSIASSSAEPPSFTAEAVAAGFKVEGRNQPTASRAESSSDNNGNQPLPSELGAKSSPPIAGENSTAPDSVRVMEYRIEDCSIAPSKSSDEMIHGVEGDIYDKWEALLDREQSEAYAIPKLITPNEHWRESHLYSFYDIVDDYDIDMRIVSHTFAIFDRYFSRGFVRAGEWTLALVSCFYLAIKINSSCNGKMLDVWTLSRECNDHFSPEQILNMEQRVCEDLDWYLNPPVPDMFVDIISSLVMSDQVNQYVDTDLHIPIEMRKELLKQSKLLCELSVVDRNFADVKPSSIALAAVMVAMDYCAFPAGANKWFSSLPLEYDPIEVNMYTMRLHWLCNEEGYHPSKVFIYSNLDIALATEQEEEMGCITMNRDSPLDVKHIDGEGDGDKTFQEVEQDESSSTPSKRRRTK